MEYSLSERNNNNTIELTSPIRNKNLENAIIPNDSKWGEKLNNYQKLKNIFHYDSKVFPRHITTKMITDNQRQFNPITQKYYNEEKEQKEVQNTRNKSLSMISKGYDKSLEVESTYDIINLKNKLEYFNFDDDTPKKPESGYAKNNAQFNYEKNNIKPYNILSNLSLRKHNYVSPDLRPKNDDALIKSNEGLIFKNNVKNKMSDNINNKYGRDFNIVNNRYRLFNDEKIKTEKQIKNLTALKKIQNIKKYDIIKGEYLNNNNINEENHKKVDKNYIVRNPINNIVYDKEEQKRLDDIEYNKKKRFHASDKLDNFRHSVGTNIEAKRLVDQQNYFNPFEYKILNKRGYDILTTEPKTLSELNQHLTDIQSKKLITDWDKIKNNADKNTNTFKTKKIYKSDYDESDIDINFSNYMKLRKPILNQRSITIDEESNTDNNKNKNLYLLKTPIHNKSDRKDHALSQSIEGIFNNNNKVFNNMEDRVDYHMKYNKMNKGLFFGTPKTVLRKKTNYKLFE